MLFIKWLRRIASICSLISLSVLALNNSQRKKKLIPIHSITRFRKHICKTNKKKSKNNVNKN